MMFRGIGVLSGFRRFLVDRCVLRGVLKTGVIFLMMILCTH